ncbi:MAG TPA: cold shock domain-containing protein, partial [archaeon]|nr:cold shock domain-containing protein [archaeon]
LGDMGMRRPPYGLVKPGIDAFSERYWISKRFAVCGMTFEEFLRALDVVIPKATRALATLFTSGSGSIGPWIKAHVSPSSGLLFYLQGELVHIHKGMPTVGVVPVDFYEGRTRDWGTLQQDLDVRRRISDDVILDAFLDKKNTKPGQAYVIKGYAGSGKAIAVRRIAWDIANLFDGLVFFLKEGALLRRDHLAELCDLVGDRIYITMEDALPHIHDIVDLLNWCDKAGRQITFIFGARTNEWNVYAGELETKVENDYELRDLTEREIRQLIEKLRAYRALGRLERKTELECFEHFKLTAERQLLVALHDLGSEKPFEEIIHNEFKNIQPAEARLLYLDVCTLHRLGVGVRAGLISRISGITYEYFQKDFFKPLEHVVRTYFDHASRDYMYRSRHSFIAEMVFKNVLVDPGERAGQIIRLIRNMDVDYSSDDVAFKELIRGRVLADLFASKTLAFQIFDAALESGAPVSFIEHQRAVFEMHHPYGRLEDALAAIERAEAALRYPDRSVAHTKATILRNYALKAPQRLARDKYREEAKGILLKQLHSTRVSHSFHTLGQLILDELKERITELEEGTSTVPAEFQERTISDLIRQGEETLQQGYQRFPEDHFLLTLESELGKLLDDKPRSVEALKRAYEASPGRSYVAVRLATYERKHGTVQKAIEILQRSLAANSQSKEAHLALAKILISHSESASQDEIIYHLKHSFTYGDSNLDAQFWYARHNFLYGDREAGLTSFRSLADAGTPPEYKKRVKGFVLDETGARRRYFGSVKTRNESYCFIACPDLRADVFAHMTAFKEADWAGIGVGAQVSFELGFVFKGAVANSVRPN